MAPAGASNIAVFLDGNHFCAVWSDTFENLQVSFAGWGTTVREAILNLLTESNL